MNIKLEKGHTSLSLSVPDEKIIGIIEGKDVPAISQDQINQIISEGIKTHSPENIGQKKIVIIIPDNTRLWARGDVFVPQIAKTLFKLGVSRDNIKIIIALGTHEDMNEKQFAQLAGTYCTRNVQILNSANKNKDRLVYIGDTDKGTQLYFTKEAVQADHIIIFGGVLHHSAAGFGGGRKYILPGIAGYETIQQNHGLTIQKDGTPHPLVRQAQLEGNPVNEDMNDAAAIFLKDKTCTYVAVAANDTGEIFHTAVGPLDSTFKEGCKALNQACCVEVSKKGDFALISTGGYRMDGQLYQSTKALSNAVNVVKDGGKILFVAACSEGVGNLVFSSVLKKYKGHPEKIGKELVLHFNMPSYVAYRVVDILNRFQVTLVSDLDRNETEALGFGYTDGIETYIQQLEGKGYIIPFAENILPVVKE